MTWLFCGTCQIRFQSVKIYDIVSCQTEDAQRVVLEREKELSLFRFLELI